MNQDDTVIYDEDFKRETRGKRFIRYGLLLGIILIAGFWLYWQNNAHKDRQLAEHVVQTNKDIATDVDKALEPYGVLLTRFSGEPGIQNSSDNPAGVDGALEQMEQAIEENPNIMNIYIGTETSQMFVRPEQELPEGYDPTARPWYRAAKEANHLLWIEPYADAMSPQIMGSLMIPVHYQGNFTGVLGMDVFMNESFSHISGPIENDLFSFVLDTSDVIIAFPADETGLNMDMVGKRLQNEALLDFIKRVPQNTSSAGELKLNSMAIAGEGDPQELRDADKGVPWPKLKKCHVAVSTLNTTGWKIVTVGW